MERKGLPEEPVRRRVSAAAGDEREKQIARERWLVENREAIDYYNSHIEKHGVFSDGLRRF